MKTSIAINGDVQVITVSYKGDMQVKYLVHITRREWSMLDKFFHEFRSSEDFTLRKYERSQKINDEFGITRNQARQLASEGKIGTIKLLMQELLHLKVEVPKAIEVSHMKDALQELGEMHSWTSDALGDGERFFIRTSNPNDVAKATEILMHHIYTHNVGSIHIGNECIWVWKSLLNHTEIYMQKHFIIDQRKVKRLQSEFEPYKILGVL